MAALSRLTSNRFSEACGARRAAGASGAGEVDTLSPPPANIVPRHEWIDGEEAILIVDALAFGNPAAGRIKLLRRMALGRC